MESRTRIQLPPHVARPFEVFVNGVPQVEGTDFEVVGTSLLFERLLVREGQLGFWRWLRMFLGVAGSYRRNDTVDVVDGLPLHAPRRRRNLKAIQAQLVTVDA